ncbi:MAG: DUF309 domain-containing protein [Leptolyngbyaceae cyanobacterium RU_5_1]|nr:DUF309 domain-containing protein [Leptolyngbyaceae cyanobacterium RU_5_1]
MEEIPEEFWQAVEQFNQRQFYACHDTLEALWIEALQSDKNFYQGVLQVAVALYHLSNQNWRGAVILMGEGTSRLRHYEPDYADIDVSDFLSETSQLLKWLQQTGAEQVAIVIQQLGLDPAHTSELGAPNPSDIKLPVLKRISPK